MPQVGRRGLGAARRHRGAGGLLPAALALAGGGPAVRAAAAVDRAARRGLDASWIAVLGEAATRPARWGVDLAFTYGPASALVTRYFTDGYLAAPSRPWPASRCVDALSWCCLARGRRRGARRRGAGACRVAAEVAALAPQLALDQDSFVFALALALLLLDLVRRPGRPRRAWPCWRARRCSARRRWPRRATASRRSAPSRLADARAAWRCGAAPARARCLAGALAAFLACGQRLGDLPAYLDLQGQAASGYGEAMYLAPDRVELGLPVGAAALVAVAGLCGAPGRWAAGRPRRSARPSCSPSRLKAGFVRADTHTQIAWSLLGLAGVAVAVGLVLRRSARAPRRSAPRRWPCCGSSAPLFLLAATERAPALARLPEVYADMGAQLAGGRGAWARFLGARRPSPREARPPRPPPGRIRGRPAAAGLPGTVDILPSEQSAVLASGARLPSAAELPGISHLHGRADRRQRGLLRRAGRARLGDLRHRRLDDRYPATTEGALWPELLRRYEPRRRVGAWVALRRRAAPLPDVLGRPRGRGPARRPVAVPDAGPVFARIDVRADPARPPRRAAVPPAGPQPAVTLGGGGGRTYRFIPAIAAGGFLLSPLARPTPTASPTSPSGRRGRRRRRRRGLRGRRVALGRPLLRAGRVGRAPARRRARRGRRAPVGGRWSRTSAARCPGAARPRLGRAGQLDGDRLTRPPPTALTDPGAAGARRLRLGFGIADGAWTEGATEGVCFAVGGLGRGGRCGGAASTPRGAGRPGPAIGRRRRAAGPRRRHGRDELPRRSCAWGWSYWNGRRIAPGAGPEREPADRHRGRIITNFSASRPLK